MANESDPRRQKRHWKGLPVSRILALRYALGRDGTSRASISGPAVILRPPSGSNWRKSASTSANGRARMEQTEFLNI
jgi:hypothetical protein